MSKLCLAIDSSRALWHGNSVCTVNYVWSAHGRYRKQCKSCGKTHTDWKPHILNLSNFRSCFRAIRHIHEVL